MKPMMKCGHRAQAVLAATQEPVCAVCSTPEARIVDDTEPDLTGRQAICSYAGRGNPSPDGTHRGGGQYAGQDYPNARPSTDHLAFFEHRPDEPYDRFYCGCWGWD